MVLAHFTFKFSKTVFCIQYTLYAKPKRTGYLLCKCLQLPIGRDVDSRFELFEHLERNKALQSTVINL